jgi:glucose/arabinose dehydrogenase
MADVRRAMAGIKSGTMCGRATMHLMTRRMLCAVGFALLPVTSVSFAQQPAPVRVRGTIEAVDGAMLTVRSRDNQTVYKIKVADDAVVRGLVRASLSEIKDNTFIGVSGLPQPDGSQKALEIHIFPEAMRGTGEGHRPWDLKPQATMTNANVEAAVAGVSKQTLTMKYKDGEKTLVVTPETVVVTYAPGDKAEVKPGTGIFISAAEKKPDGTLLTPRITYGKDGLMPPM